MDDSTLSPSWCVQVRDSKEDPIREHLVDSDGIGPLLESLNLPETAQVRYAHLKGAYIERFRNITSVEVYPKSGVRYTEFAWEPAEVVYQRTQIGKNK